ncbi:MAG: phosphatidylserine decarboxylase family protein [Holosporales bacterium]|jgi:phosphatidylserine decarboxylase|nr:phosphatidylserine decarboxylase family protein [Holosporales bacterium]
MHFIRRGGVSGWKMKVKNSLVESKLYMLDFLGVPRFWTPSSMLKSNFCVHNDGIRFIAATAAASLVLMIFSSTLACIGICLTLFCIFFFRSPKRVVNSDENLIVSPADGIISAITLEEPPQDLNIGSDQRYKVSIFLSLLNVHVNRVPFSGTVKHILYYPGSFINASFDKSSVLNERNTIVITLHNNPEKTMAFTQIAGMLARRIICDLHEGQEIKKGTIFGLIRFGSRCDVWLPTGAIPKVIQGQTMTAGESVISDISDKRKTPPSGKVI